MRILSHTLSASLLCFIVLSGCAKDEPTDLDNDGYTTEEGDCNDQDPNISPSAADLLGDDLDQNCDGADGMDADGDGWASEASGGSDCDDNDADSTIITEDADCDGALTADDCDDTDAESYIVAEDGDCDGTLTAADCDDADAESTIIADDADCDGTLTADDCDDADADSTVVAEDQDCDGALTAEDCNDSDPLLNQDDADSDGSTTCDGDCDDDDATVESLDADGDGYSTCDNDCDDGNGSANPGATDGLLFDRDCDGVASGGSLSFSEYKLVGGTRYEQAGYSVSSAGDVDGDGLADVLVGAWGNDDGGRYAGAAFVVLGSSLNTSTTIDLSNADYKLIGESVDDLAGTSVSSAGDVDGDGLDDLLVGAPWNADGGSYAGAAYIILGSSLGTTSTIDLSNADYKLVGESAGNRAGSSVSSAGDVDGDGLDDLLIGATPYPGVVYVVLGSSLGTINTIDLSNADYKLVEDSNNDNVGHSVSSAGDVDGDGLDDILLGAYGDADGGKYAGAAYVVLGSSLGTSGTIDLSNADYKLVGEAAGDVVGVSVSSAGDVNGDGLGDLLIGAGGDDNGGSAAGAAYVVLGSSLGTISTIELSSADYKLVGEAAYYYTGTSVSFAGDVDGDGLDDLLIGAPQDAYDGGAGAVYLVLGSNLGTSSTIDLATINYKLVGESSNDQAGYSVSSAGDVDGDGRDDVLVGAYQDDDGGADAGAAYLILTGG
jgi:hypothetical protein